MSRHSSYGEVPLDLWRHFIFGGVFMPDYRNSEMSYVIEEYVRNPRYRCLLRLRFCENETYDRIAENVNYSPQHVRYICKKYKDLLMNHL